MKHLSSSCLAFLIFLAGCTQNDLELTGSKVDDNATSIARTIPIASAMKTSDTFLGKYDSTRSDNQPECIAILRDAQTRSSSTEPDTLAYIFNYPENEGFSIIAAKTNVFPILAYSDKGNFDMANESSKANFIDNIAAYIDSQTLDYSEVNIDGKYPVGTSSYSITYNLGQDSPFDAYVVKENPGCPAGCVAVATAYCMLESSYLLSYHDQTFYCGAITRALKAHDEEGYEEEEPKYPKEPSYSYEEAVDKVALMMYYIGKEVYMEYTTSGSWAYSSDAYNLLKNTDFDISKYQFYNFSTIFSELEKSKIAYISGYDYGRKAGHAWVADGTAWIPTPEIPGTLARRYIHCNWGWNGNDNGFFCGDVLSINDQKNYTPKYFFTLSNKGMVNFKFTGK